MAASPVKKKKKKRYPPAFPVKRERTTQGTVILTVLGSRHLKKKKRKRRHRKGRHSHPRKLSRTRERLPVPRFRVLEARVSDKVVGTESIEWNLNPNFWVHDDIRSQGYVNDKRFAMKKCWDQLNHRFSQNRWSAARGSLYKTGGDFRLVEMSNPWFEVQGHCDLYAGTPPGVVYRYHGGFVPNAFGVDEMSSIDLGHAGISGPYDASYLSSEPYGAEAWNKFKPKTEFAPIAVAAWELQDFKSMVATSAEGMHNLYKGLRGKTLPNGLMEPGPVADHFLNHVFGWVPFLGDVASSYGSIVKQQQHLDQLKRDNGRWIHREGTLFKTEDIVNWDDHVSNDAPLVWPTLVSYLYKFPDPSRPNRFGYTTTYTRLIDEVWFAASFRYYWWELDPSIRRHLSSSLNAINDVRLKLKIHGANVSPTHIWKATPWTWIYDWFSNTTKVFENVESVLLDNLTSRYAFVMRHRLKTCVNDSTIHANVGGTQQDIFCHWEQFIETKDRKRASPFGFSLLNHDLSAKQLAILATLGISRFF